MIDVFGAEQIKNLKYQMIIWCVTTIIRLKINMMIKYLLHIFEQFLLNCIIFKCKN